MGVRSTFFAFTGKRASVSSPPLLPFFGPPPKSENASNLRKTLWECLLCRLVSIQLLFTNCESEEVCQN